MKDGKVIPQKERFLAIFNICQSDSNGCIVWTHNKNNDGYPTLGQRREGVYKLQGAHRLAYKYFKGEIPEGLLIRHLCNTKLCVNPDHLEVGTLQDNIDDEVKAGRHLGKRGHRLNLEQVAQIRELINQGLSNREIAKLFDVDRRNISLIKQNKIWKQPTAGAREKYD